MDSRIARWILAALLSAPILTGSGGISADPINGTGIPSFAPEADASRTEAAIDVLPSFLEKGAVDEDGDLAQETSPGGRDTSLDNNPLRSIEAKTLQQTGPVETTSSPTASVQDNGFSGTESPIKYPSTGVTLQRQESPVCVACDGDPPSRAVVEEQHGAGVESVTGLIWPVRREAAGREFRKKPVKRGTAPVTDSQEDSGSGDPHIRMPAGQITDTSSVGKQWAVDEFLDRATASPSRTTAPWGKGPLSPSTEKAISPDSAEIDLLLQVSRETALQSPSPSATAPEKSKKEANSEGRSTLLEGASSRSTTQGAQGSSEIATQKTREGPLSSSIPPINPFKPSDPPFHQSVTDLIDIDYYDSLDAHGPLGHFPGSTFPGVDSTKRLYGRHPPREPDLYEEEISPFDDSYFYPTTSFYADGDEDVENEDDDDDDDDDEIEESDDLKNDDVSVRETGKTSKDTTQAPKVKTAMVDEKPTSRQHVPHQTFILYGGELHPKIHPEINKDFTQTSSGSGDNSSECRNGYVKRNNSCKSLCDVYPTYCHNGGQCYIVETMGAFCRCNTQDYIWHKGLRCESIITDFQVMCVAVGTAALVVLLLFMMTVFFAKKLYLLKTENYKLRKRNRYRTPSELHNDNFSLSTIAEGSHPNEDPNAPQKVQDLPKACLKDEEPFNIQNSLSPKHESGKGDPDIADVNCVLNNLT